MNSTVSTHHDLISHYDDLECDQHDDDDLQAQRSFCVDDVSQYFCRFGFEGGSISEGRDGSGMPGTGYRAAVRQTAPADAIKIHGVPNRALDHLVGAFALTAVCKSVSSLSKPSRCPHTRWHFLNRFQTTWDLERSDVGSLPPRLIDPA
jgi:hypothetical protein